MWRYAVFGTVACIAASCSPSDDTTGSTSDCVRTLFPSYNPKAMDQCVAACKACYHGVTTTCTTSCTLKGAR